MISMISLSIRIQIFNKTLLQKCMLKVMSHALGQKEDCGKVATVDFPAGTEYQ